MLHNDLLGFLTDLPVERPRRLERRHLSRMNWPIKFLTIFSNQSIPALDDELGEGGVHAGYELGPPDRSDDALDIGVLPWRSWCGPLLLPLSVSDRGRKFGNLSESGRKVLELCRSCRKSQRHTTV